METATSVIICTHNPRMDHLGKVLASLRMQTMPKDRWELLLIDNASSRQLQPCLDFSWHLQTKFIQEKELGLTPARLRGIKESRGKLLVFVDDDNVLDPDYLESAVKISQGYPFLGAWGGQIRGQFESEPPAWTKEFWPKLAITNFTTDCWSNLTSTMDTTPSGAGMCVRRQVAESYCHSVARDNFRFRLDRTGANLTSCGDTDLAWTAYDLGLGTGKFTSLKMAHLIPDSRLEETYLLRLTESMAYSSVVLCVLRGREYKAPVRGQVRQLLGKIRRRLTMKPQRLRFLEAKMRGEEKALADLVAAGVKIPTNGQLSRAPLRA